jgi:hypothetical protein
MGKSTIPMAIFPIKKRISNPWASPGLKRVNFLGIKGNISAPTETAMATVLQWDFNGISMGFQWGFNGFSMGFQWDFDRSFSGI